MNLETRKSGKQKLLCVLFGHKWRKRYAALLGCELPTCDRCQRVQIEVNYPPAAFQTPLRRFLENNGGNLLYWSRGAVVIESYYAKQFKQLGGDLNRLVACFEDNGEMSGAMEDYFK